MRKYESIMYLKEIGLNVGELKEFDYKHRKEMFDYARYLFERFGGIIVRTDYPPGIHYKTGIKLPYMSDVKDFSQFENFVESYKEKYTYILFQMVGNEKIILSGYVYIDEMRRLCGEINDVDKYDMRKSMTISKNIKPICIEPGKYDERLSRVRADIIRARIEPHRIVEFSIYNIDGVPTPVYKQLRGKDF